MLKALVEGNLDLFERLLREFVITTLSFFDAKGKNPEAVFQAFVLGMLLNLGQDYVISSNRNWAMAAMTCWPCRGQGGTLHGGR